MEKICKNCIFWRRAGNEASIEYGNRYSEKFIYMGNGTKILVNELGVKHYKQHMWNNAFKFADFETGPEFGCIHFHE